MYIFLISSAFMENQFMTIQQMIKRKITDAIAPTHLEVINESHMHNVPSGSESHFKLVIVTDVFEGLSRVRRHQQVNGLLAEELKGSIHALSMQTLTPSEWAKSNKTATTSPDCMG
jgi:BolA protein